MNARLWLPPLVFVATAIPTVMALHLFDAGGDYKLVIAIGVGAIATAVLQTRMARQRDEKDQT